MKTRMNMFSLSLGRFSVPEIAKTNENEQVELTTLFVDYSKGEDERIFGEKFGFRDTGTLKGLEI